MVIKMVKKLVTKWRLNGDEMAIKMAKKRRKR